ncbi:MAG: flagellar export chaperone FliS [Abditibacteriales bacterium]|nr:flagellar export chaperone FliS [Abditibacteriales bacterium]MDW8368446.1 flagellar export chaperone FliS [Abditibacteriales bacterium]
MTHLLSQYQNNQAEMLSPGKRILMLFDGMIRFAENAIESHLARNEDDRRYYVGRAQAIVLALMGTLDREIAGELGDNLMRLYNYIFDLLMEGDHAADDEVKLKSLRQALEMIRELREGWAEADAVLRRSGTEGLPVTPVRNALSLVG